LGLLIVAGGIETMEDCLPELRTDPARVQASENS
jgi:hypothetical protein